MSIQTNFPAIKPTLLLDFANTEQLDPRITFTRASTATYYGTQTAKAEENLLLQSQTFETTWSVVGGGATVTANTTTAPDGTATADTLTEDSASGVHLCFQQPSLSGVVTLSVFAKLGSGTRFLTIGVSRDVTNCSSATFDLSLGTNTQAQANGTYSSPSATITAVAESFYRCTFTVTTDTLTTVRIGLNDTGTPTSANRAFGANYTGDGTSSLIIWGAQLEQRSAVTAYTPTTTQPITNYIPVLQTAASGVARFDHNPTTFESLGLLIEEQRTNLLLQSENFSTTWTNSASSEQTNVIVSPAGTLTGDKLVEDSTTGLHDVRQSITAVTGAHTFTCYIKSAERTHALLIATGGTVSRAIGFNLTTGATYAEALGGVVPPDLTSGMTSVGNGWWRCSMSWTADGQTQVRIITDSGTGTGSTTGDGYSGIYIWGAQLESSSFSTSYIPTVASQVTRSADAASMTGTNFSSWYNAGQSTLYTEAQTFSNTGTPYLVSISTNANATLGIGAFVDTSGTRWNLRVRSSSDSSVVVSYTGQVVNALNKAAIGYNQGSLSASVTLNSASPTTATRGPIVADQLTIGSNTVSASNSWNGHIRKIAYYPLAATSAQLQGLTS